MVYILLADGFEDIEAVAPIDILRRADIEVTLVGVTGSTVVSSHGLAVKTEAPLEGVDAGDLEMLVLPGGGLGVDNLNKMPAVAALVKKTLADGKLVGAICAGPTILAELGLLDGRRAVCYPSCEETLKAHGAHIETDKLVTHDKNIVTAQAAGSSIEFALKLVAMLRGWAASEKVRRAICYEHVERSLT